MTITRESRSIETVGSIYTTEHYACVWCGCDTRDFPAIKFSVHVLYGPVGGRACPRCLEAFAGRRLRASDYELSPVSVAVETFRPRVVHVTANL